MRAFQAVTTLQLKDAKGLVGANLMSRQRQPSEVRTISRGLSSLGRSPVPKGCAQQGSFEVVPGALPAVRGRLAKHGFALSASRRSRRPAPSLGSYAACAARQAPSL